MSDPGLHFFSAGSISAQVGHKGKTVQMESAAFSGPTGFEPDGLSRPFKTAWSLGSSLFVTKDIFGLDPMLCLDILNVAEDFFHSRGQRDIAFCMTCFQILYNLISEINRVVFGIILKLWEILLPYGHIVTIPVDIIPADAA